VGTRQSRTRNSDALRRCGSPGLRRRWLFTFMTTAGALDEGGEAKVCTPHTFRMRHRAA